MAKLVETRLLRRLLFDILKPTSESGENPYCVTVDGKQMWIYIKNLSPAYFSNPDVWRAQLPKRDVFEQCKNEDIPFILIGYDDDNDVCTTWNHHYVKQRLNVADSVSFYSRASLQKLAVESQELNRLTLANGMEVICFPRSMTLDVITNLNEYFPDDSTSYVALNSKRRPKANNSFKVFTSPKNISLFVDYLINVKKYSKPTANNYSGAIRRFISQALFTKYRADFLAYDDISDYPKACDTFLSHDDIKELNIVSHHVHSNALIHYIDFLCFMASEKKERDDTPPSETPTSIDWEGDFLSEDGKLTRIANPELIELLRPVLQIEYPRIVSAYNIIDDFYGSRFADTMEMKDWSSLLENIDWDYKSSTLNQSVFSDSFNIFYINSVGCNAIGRLFPNGNIVILEGSILRLEMTNTYGPKKFRDQIIREYCTPIKEGYRALKDLPPMSPSRSSGLVQGRSSNGKVDWKDKDGHPLLNYLKNNE